MTSDPSAPVQLATGRRAHCRERTPLAKPVDDQPGVATHCGCAGQYRAESAFITSGIVGNYEKTGLENDESVGLASNPHANPRDVANMIIDSGVSHAV